MAPEAAGEKEMITEQTTAMSGVFRHILVPVDFTAANEAALKVALAMASQNAATVTLLHVIEHVEMTDDKEMQEFHAMLESKAGHELESLAKRCGEEGAPVETAIVYGRRAGQIVHFAEDNQIDLIVLSSHKVDLDEMTGGWGTLSHQVSVFCQCPVLLVK